MSADKQLREQLERAELDLDTANERLAKAMPIVRAVAAAAPSVEHRHPSEEALVVINTLRLRSHEITVKQVREAAALVEAIAKDKEPASADA